MRWQPRASWDNKGDRVLGKGRHQECARPPGIPSPLGFHQPGLFLRQGRMGQEREGGVRGGSGTLLGPGPKELAGTTTGPRPKAFSPPAVSANQSPFATQGASAPGEPQQGLPGQPQGDATRSQPRMGTPGQPRKGAETEYIESLNLLVKGMRQLQEVAIGSKDTSSMEQLKHNIELPTLAAVSADSAVDLLSRLAVFGRTGSWIFD